MRVLALDFDGVISDSAPESFVVALRTYRLLRPEASVSGLSGLAELADRATVEAVRIAPLYRKFVELMPLGNRAEDFAVALAILAAGDPVADQAGYDRVYARESELPPGFLASFHARFYQQRRELRSQDPARWERLLGPYPEFLDLLRRRRGDVVLALATAKDRESVELLLRSYAIDDLIPDSLVFDKETGVDKKAHLSALRERTRVDFEQITFVDDKLNHLDSVASLGVRCVLASWGYNGERERRLARERGHLVCSLENFERHVFA